MFPVHIKGSHLCFVFLSVFVVVLSMNHECLIANETAVIVWTSHHSNFI